LLSTQNLALKQGKSRKLFPRFIGPFTIKHKVNPVAYELHLPSPYKLHNAFHVSLLKPYRSPPGTVRPPKPIVLDDATEFEVESILDHATVGKGKKKEIWYQVKWLGYGDDYNTWEPASNLKNSPLILQEYWEGLGDPSKGPKAK